MVRVYSVLSFADFCHRERQIVKTNTIIAITTESPKIPSFSLSKERRESAATMLFTCTTGITNVGFNFAKYDTNVLHVARINSMGMGIYNLTL